MNIITTIADWLGYTIGTSIDGDNILYTLSAVVVLMFVIFIISIINRILNTFLIGTRKND